MFFKIGVFKNFSKFTGHPLCWSLLLIKLQVSFFSASKHLAFSYRFSSVYLLKPLSSDLLITHWFLHLSIQIQKWWLWDESWMWVQVKFLPLLFIKLLFYLEKAVTKKNIWMTPKTLLMLAFCITWKKMEIWKRNTRYENLILRSSLFTQESGIIHREKIRIQSNL